MQTTNEVTIDAHGEQTIFGATFQLPLGRTVRFYVEQGVALAAHQGRRQIGTPNEYHYSNSLEAIALGVATPAAVGGTFVGPCACPNYNLTKINKSAGGCFGGAWSNWIGERFDHDYTSVERFIDSNPTSSDIITIRNRAGKMAITLEEVIAALPQLPTYPDIRCCFCRSGQNLFATTPSRQVTGAARPASLGGGTY